jgi:hypothetical protein
MPMLRDAENQPDIAAMQFQIGLLCSRCAKPQLPLEYL